MPFCIPFVILLMVQSLFVTFSQSENVSAPAQLLIDYVSILSNTMSGAGAKTNLFLLLVVVFTLSIMRMSLGVAESVKEHYDPSLRVFCLLSQSVVIALLLPITLSLGDVVGNIVVGNLMTNQELSQGMLSLVWAKVYLLTVFFTYYLSDLIISKMLGAIVRFSIRQNRVG